ncbi:hypothetical protein BDZ89DRAFT_1139553 [Hymenopellis radicata]|nr:hypothetical protein BDZ89DRAFT_1139553 [Hymenopellis radicata]
MLEGTALKLPILSITFLVVDGASNISAITTSLAAQCSVLRTSSKRLGYASTIDIPTLHSMLPLPTFVRTIVKKERFRRRNEEQGAKELRKKKDGKSAPMEHYYDCPQQVCTRQVTYPTRLPTLRCLCWHRSRHLFLDRRQTGLVSSHRHRLITKELTLPGDESDPEEVTVMDLIPYH